MNSELSIGKKTALYGVLLILLVPFVFPQLWMVLSSFKSPNEILSYPPTLWPNSPQLGAYAKVFELQPFARQYANSLYIAAIVTLGTMVVSALAGFAFARIPFKGRNVWFFIVLCGLLVPSEATIVPLFQLFTQLGWINTHLPLIIVPIFGAQAVLSTFIMRQFFLSLPSELEEAARIDGLGWFQIWWRIALPLSRSALSAVAIFAFLNSWNLFLEPVVYLSSTQLFTLPQALVNYVDAYGGPMWDIQLAASSLVTIPVLVVYIIAQKQFIEGLAHTGNK